MGEEEVRVILETCKDCPARCCRNWIVRGIGSSFNDLDEKGWDMLNLPSLRIGRVLPEKSTECGSKTSEKFYKLELASTTADDRVRDAKGDGKESRPLRSQKNSFQAKDIGLSGGREIGHHCCIYEHVASNNISLTGRILR